MNAPPHAIRVFYVRPTRISNSRVWRERAGRGNRTAYSPRRPLYCPSCGVHLFASTALPGVILIPKTATSPGARRLAHAYVTAPPSSTGCGQTPGRLTYELSSREAGVATRRSRGARCRDSIFQPDGVDEFFKRRSHPPYVSSAAARFEPMPCCLSFPPWRVHTALISLLSADDCLRVLAHDQRFHACFDILYCRFRPWSDVGRARSV